MGGGGRGREAEAPWSLEWSPTGQLIAVYTACTCSIHPYRLSALDRGRCVVCVFPVCSSICVLDPSRVPQAK